MKRILFINIFIFITTVSFTQIGIKAGYLLSDFSNIENDILPDNKVDVFNNGYMTGINYSVRVNGKGIVLISELGFNFFTSKAANKDFKFQQISAGIPVKFYPFNLEGDCGCPDFSLRNKFFEKHFFLMFNNAFFYNVKSMTSGDTETWDDYFSFKIGLGTGITIPLTDALRLEPFLTYNWGFNDKWIPEMLAGQRSDAKVISYNNAEFGIRVGMVFE